MKRKIVVTTAAAAVLAATLVVGATYAYLTDSSEVTTNTFTENGNDVELDETTGSDYDIIPGTEQEKDPTITATYTLDSYVYVKVTDETEGLVEWYIANGWSELDDYENVFVMELRTIYDAETWTLVEDEENAYYGQYTYTDDNGVTYYYNAENGEYTAIIPVLEDNKVSYSADITNDDMTVGETVNLTFQAYIMQMSGFDSAEDAYYDMIVTRLTANTIAGVKKIMDYETVEVTMVGRPATSSAYTLYAKNNGTAVLDFAGYGLTTGSTLKWTGGTLTLKGSEGDLESGFDANLYVSASNKTVIESTGEAATINIESGQYTYNQYGNGTLVKASDGATVNIDGGIYTYLFKSYTSANAKMFSAEDGTIYVNAVTEINATKTSTNAYVINIFTVTGSGTIYVNADLYDELVNTYNVDGSKVQVLADGCSAVLDAESGYYVITAD